MALSPGQVIHNRYKVISLVGQGGMGSVCEAMDLTLNVPCALKEMVPYPGTSGTAMPQLREQFRQEARLLAELRHPNVPRVTDHFEEDNNAYLVMDFIYGKRLDEIVTEKKELPVSEVLGWARQLMEALAYCHEEGVIHRDVKPQNVIITSQGKAVLVDFGLAKLVDPDDPRTRTVMQGLGTPEYAPPEQYDRKKGYTDPRSDIYSLGATLYHAIVGEPPPAVPERVMHPKSLLPVRRRRDDVSKITDQVLMKAMALQPDQRFDNVAEMYEALFGLRPPTMRAEGASSRSDGGMLAPPAERTVLLPWSGLRGLLGNRRLGIAIGFATIASLVILIPLLSGVVSGESMPTVTPTAVVTMTSTRAPTSTPSPSATPTTTPTPTSGPSTRQPLGVPQGVDVSTATLPPTATATETLTPVPTTRVVIPPTDTPVPPTDTPPPPPTSRPQPQPTQPQPPSPPPTAIPTQVPTNPPPEPTKPTTEPRNTPTPAP